MMNGEDDIHQYHSLSRKPLGNSLQTECEPLVKDDLGNVQINVLFTDYNIKKAFVFDADENVYEAKQLILEAVEEQLYDPLNYGLYLPPSGGRAGKFLDDERPLDDYKLPGPVGQLEFKYKRRVYRLTRVDQKKLKLLHSKGNLKQFFDAVKSNSVDKVTRYSDKGMDPNFIEPESGETPLTIATKGRHNRNMILQLVNGGAHIDYRNSRTLTAMHTAALYGNAEAIKTLLELGGSPNYKDHNGHTPLYLMCKKRNSPAICAELLLRDYALIGCRDELSNTELHQACKVGNHRVLELLLFYGAESDFQNNNGATALHICASSNELSCLQTLLVRGADKALMNNARQTPYDLANISGHRAAANILDKHDSLLVVPFEESPQYNINRRLAGANLEALRQLSRSDPRISLAHSVTNLASLGGAESLIMNGTAGPDLGHLGLYDSLSVSRALIRRHTSLRSSHSITFTPPSSACGKTYICVNPYKSLVMGQLQLNEGDRVTVLSTREDGMWEGQSKDKVGWFPTENVQEAAHTSGLKSATPDNGKALPRQSGAVRSISLDHGAPLREEAVRTVVLQKTKKGYGFVLRGAKADQLKKLNIQFIPSEKIPALQYLDSIEKGSSADKAGLRVGDFLLEIDTIDVRCASHEKTVEIIKRCSSLLAMKVIRPQVHSRTPSFPTSSHLDGTATLPSRKPRLPEAAGGTLHYTKPGVQATRIEEQQAIDQLDATLANYDNDTRGTASSGLSGLIPTDSKDAKIASIRQRPNSSHFTSIQELDDMFNETSTHKADHPSQPFTPAHAQQKADEKTRKPAQSRAKKFWIRGKNKKSSSLDKAKSLSQPNLAMLENETEYSMPEYSYKKSKDLGPGFLSSLSRKHSTELISFSQETRLPTSPDLPSPPNFPAPIPFLDDVHYHHRHTGSLGSTSSFTTSPSTAQSSQSDFKSQTLPRLLLHANSNVILREKIRPPKPPARSVSQDMSQSALGAMNPISPPLPPPPAEQPLPTPPPEGSNPFANALQKAVDDRHKRASSTEAPETRSLSCGTRETSPRLEKPLTIDEQLKMAISKRQSKSVEPPNQSKSHTSSNRSSLSPPVMDGKSSPASTSMTELQRVMNRLTVNHNNNTASKDSSGAVKKLPPPPPPPIFKKPGLPLAKLTQVPPNPDSELSPLDEFPPPPPLETPEIGVSENGPLIIPPPSFEPPPPSQLSPQTCLTLRNSQERDSGSSSHEMDNSSISSSVGSDAISSVSQDNFRFSIATSGYSSDTARSNNTKSPPARGVDLWSCDEVGDWLDSIGLSDYKLVFADNCIEGETLIHMSKQDIKELGVEKIGHRVKLEKEIKKLMPDSSA